MREKITEIVRDYPRLGSIGVTEQLYEKIAERILSLIHSEMVGLIPALTDVYLTMNGLEHHLGYCKGRKSMRSELLSAIEKKFGRSI